MSNTTTAARTSFGLTIGRALGHSAAYAAHGAIRAGQMTGQFGKDVAAGAGAAYAEKSEQLRIQREEMLAAIEAADAADVIEVAPVAVKRQAKASAAIKPQPKARARVAA